jgi:hypothetical protein
MWTSIDGNENRPDLSRPRGIREYNIHVSIYGNNPLWLEAVCQVESAENGVYRRGQCKIWSESISPVTYYCHFKDGCWWVTPGDTATSNVIDIDLSVPIREKANVWQLDELLELSEPEVYEIFRPYYKSTKKSELDQQAWEKLVRLRRRLSDLGVRLCGPQCTHEQLRALI